MRFAWLCHPATAVAVIVLLINDHLLKQAFPGFVTGKLSDVAGLVVAPALVGLLFGRRGDLAALVLTGVLFTLVKTTQGGAEAASYLWSLVAGPSRVLADPTDLLALPALGLAWWSRNAPAPARWRVLATTPLAVLAVTATAGIQQPFAGFVEADSESIRVFIHERTAVSRDGGKTWTAEHGEPARSRQSAACVPHRPELCYRVVPGRLAVEESRDYGRTWRPSWTSPPGREGWLARESTEPITSLALAVQARPDGHVVVVANGPDGILLRDVDGDWSRVGWPADFEGDDHLGPERTAAWLVAAIMFAACLGASLRRYFGPYAFCVTMVLSAFYLAFGDNDRPSASLYLGVFGVLGILALAIVGLPRWRSLLVALGVGPLSWVTVFVPFYGWSQGTPETYGAAVTLAVLLTAGVTAAAVWLIRRDAARPDPRKA